jgi:hypothetical protein
MVVPPQDSVAGRGNASSRRPPGEGDLGWCARAYAESNFEREAILRRIFGQLMPMQRVVTMRSRNAAEPNIK